MNKKIKNKKGISLIVLIITIAVIIILATAVILSIANNRPIESAKEATELHNDAVLKESAAVLSAQWKTDSLLNKTTLLRSEYVKEGLKTQGFTEEEVASVQVSEDGSISLADVWDGTVATSYSSGDGSITNPYKISTSEEFAYLSEQVRKGVSYENKYIELDVDLNLNNIQFEIIGAYLIYFNGRFNGNNHKIYNLNLNMSREESALFLVKGGTVENLVIEKCELYSSNPANAVIATLNGNSTVRNCVNKANLTTSNFYACGIAYVSTGSNNIENCTNYGVITTTYDNGTAYQISNGNNANCKELGKAVATH